MSDIPIVVMSARRAGRVLSHRLVNNAIICCPASEADAYRQHYPDNEVIAHPNSIRLLCMARQFVYDHFGDVFMLDDDLGGVKRQYLAPGDKTPAKLTPDEATDLINASADICRRLGLYLFGFSKDPNPLMFRVNKPIRMRGWVIGAAMGLLRGSRLYFDPDYNLKDDYWISLLNAYHHRACYVDERINFYQTDGTFRTSGGQANQRTLELQREHHFNLVRAFGADIVFQKEATRIAKLRTDTQTTIILPF
jgi:hypothetical protein